MAGYHPVRTDDGQVVGVGTFVLDATDLRTAERLARRSEERLRLALDAANLGTWHWEVAYGTDNLFWDSRCKALFGLPEDAEVGYADWLACLVEEDRAATEEAVNRALDPTDPDDSYVCAYRIRHPDGMVRWLSAAGRAVFDAHPTVPGGRQPVRLLGTIRDITAAHESVAALARSNAEAHAAAERVQLALSAGAIVGTWDWELPTDRFTVDERFAFFFGLDPALGRSGLSLEQVVATVHPDDLAGLRAAVATAIARGGPYSHEYRVRGLDGSYRWIQANGRVDHAADGTPARFPGVLLDIQARRALEAERDRAANLLRAFVAAVPGVVYAKDREGRMLVANEGTAALVGKPLEAILGRTDAEFLDDPGNAALVMANDRRIMDAGTTEQIEEAVSFSDGTPAVWLSTKAPFRSPAGEVVGLIGSSVNITDRKQAEERLRESETNLRLASEAGGIGFFACDLVTGRTHWSEMMYRLYGLNPSLPPPCMEPDGDHLDIVHPDDRAALSAARAAVTEAEGPTNFAFEFRVRRADTGESRWIASRGEVARDANGRAVLVRGAQQDITDRREAEGRLRLMVHELNHRVKNTLATVQSITMQSLRGVDAAVRCALEDRLLALAVAHDVLTREGWVGADVDEVVAGVLAPHGGREDPRFLVSGPPLKLAPRAAVALSMALQELATNALKFGALSVPAGHVAIDWEVSSNSTPHFRLLWKELGGPAVMPPARRGFGTQLVERSLAQDLGGTARIEFCPDGVVCRVEAPFAGIVASAGMVPLVDVGQWRGE